MAKQTKKDDECWKKGGKDCGPGEKPPMFSPNNKGFRFSMYYFVLVLIALMLLNTFFSAKQQEQVSTVEYSVFKEMVREGEIRKVGMGTDVYYGYTTTDEQQQGIVYKTQPVDDPTFVPLMDDAGAEYFSMVTKQPALLNFIVSWLVPLLFLVFIWRIMFKRMGNMGGNVLSFGKNRVIIVAEGQTGVTFDDVAGADEAKEELAEVVDFLKNPQKYTEIGGKIPKGVLLVGAPGTGKTLLARAVAGVAHVPFFRMSGADFVEMFVGVGAARVRDLFKQAREKAPCIVFIDELDAIGRSRVNSIGGNDEREQTLNQLLVEMDGFDSTTGLIILAATNRPEILDAALLRPGRFDRTVLVDKPDMKGREEILRIHTANVKLEKEVSLMDVAKATPGFVGADLANIVNEAALLAVRAGRKLVSQKDFSEAIDKVVAGLAKKNRLINKKEREIVAFHETGHALVAALTEGSDPVQKVSIVPRGLGALGYTMQTPTEDRYLLTKSELLGKIDVLLGGRAAEELIFSDISTGASNDLTRATDIARKMITDYGMSERFRNVALTKRSTPFLGERAEPMLGREYSENTQSYVDEEVARIINERYDHTLTLLKDNRERLNKITEKLLSVEVLEAEEFLAMAKS